MAILIDSSVWIDFFNGKKTAQTDYLYQGLGTREFFTGDLILAEVLQGFRTERDLKTARKALLSFPSLSLCGKEIAVKSAVNYRVLREGGMTAPKAIDCIIATFCIEHQIALLHSHHDFDPFAALGLKSVQSSKFKV